MAFREKTIEPAVEFLKKIKRNDGVAIVFGHDADTVCSAAIMCRLLKKLGAKVSLVVSGENFTVTKDVPAKIKKLKPSYIIILDIADVDERAMIDIGVGNVLAIDHHIPKSYAWITYVNPRLLDGHAYIPVTYLCYRTYKRFFADDVSWIAGIGVLGDHGVTGCLDLFEDIKSRYPELVGDSELVDEDLFDGSLIGKLTKLVDNARVVAGARGSMRAADVLVGTLDYQSVVGDKELGKWNALAETEFKRIISDFWKNKSELDGVVFYMIESRYNFKSALSGYLQQSFEDKIIAIGQKDGKVLDVSFRRGAKVRTDLSQLAGRVVEGIPDSTGGGHEAASAIRIPVGEVKELFKILSS